MRSPADYLFALMVALLTGGGWHLAHWGLLIARDQLRAVLRHHVGGAA